MDKLELTDKITFDPTIEFEYFGRHLDFHNDFKCHKINCDSEVKTIKFYFVGQQDYFSLTFENSSYYHVEYEEFGQGNDFGLTLDNFSKVTGKEMENGRFLDFNDTESFKYFQVDFWGGLCFIIKTERCFLVDENFDKFKEEQDFKKKIEDLRLERIEMRKRYKKLEDEKLSGLIDAKTFIIEKQRIRDRISEIRQVLGDSFVWEDFKI